MMATPTKPMAVMLSESLEHKGKDITELNGNILQSPISQQPHSSSDGSVAILWDIENCPVPSDVRPEDVAGNIRMALQVHPLIEGTVMVFSAYGDFNAFPKRLREGCLRTGVNLIDVPNGRKDAADKAILVDMLLFALDNPPPSSIMLISGDVDFARALHILGQRGYTIILVIPSRMGVSSALCNAGMFVWDWPNVARGEGFVPPRGGSVEVAGYLMGCHINDNLEGQNEEEAIVYRGMSQRLYNSRDFSMVSQSLSEYNYTASNMAGLLTTMRSHSLLPPGMIDVSGISMPSSDNNEGQLWGPMSSDLNVLKGQLVKLLELSGGCLPLARVPTEYQKAYGRTLYVSDYGAIKLVNLFKKMGDTMAVEGKGQRKFVYLRNFKKDKKGKGLPEENTNTVAGGGSSDEFSDEERLVMEEHDESSQRRAAINDRALEQFKFELQEILVSYSCRIFLGCFEDIYQQRYKRQLEYEKLGVNKLEDLFEKVNDIVVLVEEAGSKRKFLDPVGG
ncbi:hypothetical protein HN51_046836 [Arachis hypogaea]|uniref:HTH OST-type domain-containing protein n=2 Tax=Arachis TaxID=3817 RepID=A0A445AE56_ARAHY|nr:uncharacterized protein DS421_12g360240 [Arachis hypogaea]RYR24713.1 hypothetical protein Ahy_B02g058232 [Arachis hypogaea]